MEVPRRMRDRVTHYHGEVDLSHYSLVQSATCTFGSGGLAAEYARYTLDHCNNHSTPAYMLVDDENTYYYAPIGSGRIWGTIHCLRVTPATGQTQLFTQTVIGEAYCFGLPRATYKTFRFFHACIADAPFEIHDPQLAARYLDVVPNPECFDIIVHQRPGVSMCHYYPKARPTPNLSCDIRPTTNVGGFFALALPTLDGTTIERGYHVTSLHVKPTNAAYTTFSAPIARSLCRLFSVDSVTQYRWSVSSSLELNYPAEGSIVLGSPEAWVFCVPVAISIIRLLALADDDLIRCVARIDGDEICYALVDAVAAGDQSVVEAIVNTWYSTFKVTSSSSVQAIWCAAGMLHNHPSVAFCVKSLAKDSAHAIAAINPSYARRRGIVNLRSVLTTYVASLNIRVRSHSSRYLEPRFQVITYNNGTTTAAVVTGYRAPKASVEVVVYNINTSTSTSVPLAIVDG